jgi:hypothetical protein
MGLTFKSPDWFSSGAVDDLTTVHFPKVMTCGLEAANAIPEKRTKERMTRKRMLMQ